MIHWLLPGPADIRRQPQGRRDIGGFVDVSLVVASRMPALILCSTAAPSPTHRMLKSSLPPDLAA